MVPSYVNTSSVVPLYVPETVALLVFVPPIVAVAGVPGPPIVYSFPAIVILSLAFKAVTVNVEVPFLLSTKVPAIPASCALSVFVAVAPSVPFNRYISLNFVVSDTRSISIESWSISSWIALRSVVEFVPFADCVASSFIRWSIE